MAEENKAIDETPEEKLVEAIEDLDVKPIESEKLNEPEKLLEEVVEKEVKYRGREEMEKERQKQVLESWVPKTKLGKEVKSGKIKNIDEILDKKIKILEPQIVDSLMEVKSDLILVGQSKGKFGGGKRRAWRQTQRKTMEGNVPTFSAFAVVGDENGHIGIGMGKATETLPARDKAIRKAKLNLTRITRGDGSFDSIGGGNSSIPYKINGKAGSVRITLTPAPPGTGLVVGDQLKKVLKLAGIKDIYGRSSGQIRTSFNLVKACIDALQKTNQEVKAK